MAAAEGGAGGVVSYEHGQSWPQARHGHLVTMRPKARTSSAVAGSDAMALGVAIGGFSANVGLVCCGGQQATAFQFLPQDKTDLLVNASQIGFCHLRQARPLLWGQSQF